MHSLIYGDYISALRGVVQFFIIFSPSFCSLCYQVFVYFVNLSGNVVVFSRSKMNGSGRVVWADGVICETNRPSRVLFSSTVTRYFLFFKFSVYCLCRLPTKPRCYEIASPDRHFSTRTASGSSSSWSPSSSSAPAPTSRATSSPPPSLSVRLGGEGEYRR